MLTKRMRSSNIQLVSLLLVILCWEKRSQAYSSFPKRKRPRLFTTYQIADPLQPWSENTNTDNHHLCQPLPITYTNDPTTIEQWIHHNVYLSPYSHVGFDVESVPNVPWIQSCNGWVGPATIQLSTPEEALVVQLTHRKRSGVKFVMPSPLKHVLEDETICKVGMGIDCDMMELYEYCYANLHPKCRCDVSDIYQQKKGGLKSFMKRILDIDLPKRKKITISDWSRVPLKPIQLEYAAHDAWAGAVLFNNNVYTDLLLQEEYPIKELYTRAKQRKWARKQISLMRNQYHQYTIHYDKEQEVLLNHTLEEGQALIQKEFHRLFQIIQDTAPPKRTTSLLNPRQQHKP